MFKFGLVGCGQAGENHLQELLSLPQVKLVALADIREETVKNMGRKYGIRNLYTNYREMFTRERLDAVAVITNADAHYPIVSNALQANLHILCEKPLTVEPEESWELVKLAKQKKKILAVTFTYRFVPDTRRIKEIISSGEIGQIVEMRFISLNGKFQPYPEGSDEKRKYDRVYTKAKGMIFDCGIHTFDLFRWYAQSEVKRIDGRGTCHLGYPYPDTATAIIEFKNGIKAVYDYGKLPYFEPKIPSQTFFRIIITGNKGSILWFFGIDKGQKSVLKIFTSSGCREEKFPIYGKARKLQYRQFAESIAAGKLQGYFPSLEDDAMATEIADRVVKVVKDNLIISPLQVNKVGKDTL